MTRWRAAAALTLCLLPAMSAPVPARLAIQNDCKPVLYELADLKLFSECWISQDRMDSQGHQLVELTLQYQIATEPDDPRAFYTAIARRIGRYLRSTLRPDELSGAPYVDVFVKEPSGRYDSRTTIDVVSGDVVGYRGAQLPPISYPPVDATSRLDVQQGARPGGELPFGGAVVTIAVAALWLFAQRWRPQGSHRSHYCASCGAYRPPQRKGPCALCSSYRPLLAEAASVDAWRAM